MIYKSRLDSWEKQEIFSNALGTPVRSTQRPVQWAEEGAGSNFTEDKASTKFMNGWRCTSVTPYAFMAFEGTFILN